MEGAAWRAILKVPLSRASPSPTYMLYSCAPDRGNMEALLAVAAALASVVLLQPAHHRLLYGVHNVGGGLGRAGQTGVGLGYTSSCAHWLQP